jgi:hypothetical protein
MLKTLIWEEQKLFLKNMILMKLLLKILLKYIYIYNIPGTFKTILWV